MQTLGKGELDSDSFFRLEHGSFAKTASESQLADVDPETIGTEVA